MYETPVKWGWPCYCWSGEWRSTGISNANAGFSAGSAAGGVM